MNKTNFIKLPRSYFTGDIVDLFEDRDIDFIIQRALIYCHLNMYATARGESRTSIEELVRAMGYSGNPSHCKSSPYYRILCEVLDWFAATDYLEVVGGMDEHRYNELLMIYIDDVPVSPYKPDGADGEPFLMVDVDSLVRYGNIRLGSGADKHKCFYVMLHAINMIHKRTSGTIEQWPECGIITAENIQEKTHYSINTVYKYLDALVDARVFKRKQLDSGRKGSPPFIYVVNKPGWEKELEYGLRKFNKED